jgi:diaminopimelate epimerase
MIAMRKDGSEVTFYKTEGAGNDFVIIPAELPVDPTTLARSLCDRRRGVGADGVIWLDRSDVSSAAAFRTHGFNCDGTQMQTCINGYRCAALLAFKTGWTGPSFDFETARGRVKADVSFDFVALELPGPRGTPVPIQLPSEFSAKVGFAVWSGDPHLVVELPTTVFAAVDFVTTARGLRWWTGVSQFGSNVHFISNIRGSWTIRSYERGVENETMACGSGCMAAALAISFSHPDLTEYLFDTRGGDVIQVVRNSTLWRVSGPATIVFEGKWLIRNNLQSHKLKPFSL